MTGAPSENIHETIGDSRLQSAIFSATQRLIDHRSGAVQPDLLPQYQDLRTLAHEIKKHTINHLDYYLEQFESKVVAHGGKVIFCRDGQDVADFRSEEHTSELQLHSF